MLNMELIINTVKKISSQCSEINNSTFNKVMTIITLVCNSATFRYKGDEGPIVRVPRNDSEQCFLYDTGAQRSFMPFKAFKCIYRTPNCKSLPEKDLHIKDTGGNDLGY